MKISCYLFFPLGLLKYANFSFLIPLKRPLLLVDRKMKIHDQTRKVN